MSELLKILDDEQKALKILTNELQNAKKQDQQTLRDAIELQVKKIDEICKKIEDEINEKYPDAIKDVKELEKNAVVEVVLTPDQRQRILEKTNVDVPSIKLFDPNATLTKNMKHLKPSFVEEQALQQALFFKELSQENENNNNEPTTPEQDSH